MDILSLLNVQLNAVLRQLLPQIESDWWHLLVLEKLTYQQQSFAQKLPNNALEQLDLSALLRVIDQNWYELAELCHFSKDARNWLKEAQSIRNRWAHAPAGGLPDEIIYRDIDTIDRLLQVLGAETETLDKVSQHKRHILKKIALAEVDATDQYHSPEVMENRHVFKVGDVVCLKVDTNKTGAIIIVLPTDLENRYQVFHDGVIATYYESQLTLINSTPTRQTITPAGLHAAMTALQ